MWLSKPLLSALLNALLVTILLSVTNAIIWTVFYRRYVQQKPGWAGAGARPRFHSCRLPRRPERRLGLVEAIATPPWGRATAASARRHGGGYAVFREYCWRRRLAFLFTESQRSFARPLPLGRDRHDVFAPSISASDRGRCRAPRRLARRKSASSSDTVGAHHRRLARWERSRYYWTPHGTMAVGTARPPICHG